MAMLHRPRLLMLDEPTTGVDIATRTRLLAAIRDLTRRDGCAVLYSTHYLPEIEELGATVAIIDRGRMLARGLHDDLVDQHGTGVVELTFEVDHVPALDDLRRRLGHDDLRVDGQVVRVPADRPGVEAAELLPRLRDLAQHLSSVELIRPSLEAVFLAVTGRSYAADDEQRDDASGPDGTPGGPATTDEKIRA